MTQRTTPLFFFVLGIFIVLLLWLPFGFQMTGLIEEWGVLGVFSNHSLFFFVTPDSPMAAHYLRPLTVFPHAMGYFLDPDSFKFWHVISMLSFFIKVISTSFIAWILTRSREWSAFFGLLVLLYPADTMQLSFRGLHINLSIAFLLAAAAMNLAAYHVSKKLWRNILILGSFILFLSSIWLYETAIALTPITFILLLVRDGFKEGWKNILQQPAPLLFWLLAPIFYMGYIILLLVFWPLPTYQKSITTGLGFTAFFKNYLPKLFSIGLVRALIGGWVDSLRIVISEFKNHFYLIFAALACTVLVFFMASSKTKEIEKKTILSMKWPFLLRMSLGGLLLLLLGYAPYLFSMAHIYTSQRTFIFVAPGAALVVLAFLMGTAKINRWLAIFLSSLVLLLGIGAQLYQFHHYQQISDHQRQILKTIVENFDGNFGTKKLLVLDGSNQLDHTWMLQYNLASTLGYLYGKGVPSLELCLMPENSWFRKDGYARNGICAEEPNQWTFKAQPLKGEPLPPNSPETVSIKKNDLIVIKINPDGSIQKDPALDSYRSSLKTGQDTIARRYRNILETKSWPFKFNQFHSGDNENKERFHLFFGRWWGMEMPVRGAGWREAEWQINILRHRSFAWKNQERSSLLFELAPVQKSYRLEGQFSAIVNEKIKNSMDIKINNYKVHYRWLNGAIFQADIPVKELKKGLNRIEINSIIDPKYFGLAAQLQWLKVLPKD